MAFSHTRKNMVDVLDNSTGILKDNAAGDISATDLRDAIAGNWMGFDESTKTGAITAVVGSLYPCDVSATGSNADIEVTMPGSPSKGDVVGYYIQKAHASHTYNVDLVAGPTTVNGASYTGAAAGKWSLWVNSEYLLFKYIDATIGWLVIADGRIPHTAALYDSSGTSIGNGHTVIDLDDKSTNGHDNADLGDLANDEITIKRSGKYLVQCRISRTLMTANKSITPHIRLKPTPTYICSGLRAFCTLSNGNQYATAQGILELSNGDDIELDVYCDDTTTKAASVSAKGYMPFLEVSELFA